MIFRSLHNNISRWLHIGATQWKLVSMAHLAAPDIVLKQQLRYMNGVICQTFASSLCYSQAAVLERQSPQTLNQPLGAKDNGNNATWKFVCMVLFPLQGILYFISILPHRLQLLFLCTIWKEYFVLTCLQITNEISKICSVMPSYSKDSQPHPLRSLG